MGRENYTLLLVRTTSIPGCIMGGKNYTLLLVRPILSIYKFSLFDHVLFKIGQN
jgi:hypothetical protein